MVRVRTITGVEEPLECCIPSHTSQWSGVVTLGIFNIVYVRHNKLQVAAVVVDSAGGQMCSLCCKK